MGIVEAAARWLVKKYNRGQATFCYCPGCGLELCRSESWYADPKSDLVRYQCVQCGTRSGWLFAWLGKQGGWAIIPDRWEKKE